MSVAGGSPLPVCACCHLTAVVALHPLGGAGLQTGGGHHGHQAAIVSLCRHCPGYNSGGGIQQPDADILWPLAQLLQELTGATWNTCH